VTIFSFNGLTQYALMKSKKLLFFIYTVVSLFHCAVAMKLHNAQTR